MLVDGDLLPTVSFGEDPLSLNAAHLSLEDRTELELYLDTYSGPRLVQLRQEPTPRWITEGEKALLVWNHVRFVDVTDDDQTHGSQLQAPTSVTYPAKLSHDEKHLRGLFKRIDLGAMKQFLRQFTNFHTRHYRSHYGLHAKYNPHANITFTEFKHSSWDQKSIIAHWAPRSRHAGSDNTTADAATAPVIILSAHQDSTGPLPFMRAPGADDDASGTVALVETVSVLLQSGWEPVDRPVEWMFLSAEECGLCGSEEVVRSYREQKREIKAMYHMDVTAYLKPGTEPVIGLITDGVSSALTDYIELLIDEYATLPVARTQCGYACSDHGSFDKAGYPAACLSEGKFADSNPHMHTADDTMDRPEYSIEHISEFVRIGLGYVVELAGGLKEGGGKKGAARRLDRSE
ncbi:hypothetical protein BMF94_2230 [Rhodotorula taiwanensis]|uniref:Peptide hydrolase n=1 Tax=Rhodotorula taiwanensis TaxID=741276 RepID=A0A2S5BDA8_9BASI|nr:hypothetical protein BMF94_2230 [Rhodotorula taiwanensis]